MSTLVVQHKTQSMQEVPQSAPKVSHQRCQQSKKYYPSEQKNVFYIHKYTIWHECVYLVVCSYLLSKICFVMYRCQEAKDEFGGLCFPRTTFSTTPPREQRKHKEHIKSINMTAKFSNTCMSVLHVRYSWN